MFSACYGGGIDLYVDLDHPDVEVRNNERKQRAFNAAGKILPRDETEVDAAHVSTYTDSQPRCGVEKSFKQTIRYSSEGPASIKSEPMVKIFRQACERHSTKVALSVERGDLSGKEALPEAEWTSWTYAEYLRDVEYASCGFISFGAETFVNSIGIWGFNAPEWHISCVAATMVCCPAAGIYPTDTPEQVSFKMHHSASSVLVLEDAKKLKAMTSIIDELPDLKVVIMYGGKPDISSIPRKDGSAVPVFSWADFLARGKTEYEKAGKDELAKREAAVEPGNCMVLIYTSGTTGNPKAVMISNDTLFFELSAVIHANPHFHNDGSGMRVLSYLPLSHVAGMMVDIWMPIFGGVHVNAPGKVCFARPTDLKDGTIAHRLTFTKPTVFLGVPRVWEKIAEKLKAKGKETTGLKKSIVTWAKGLALSRAQSMQLTESTKDTNVPVPFMMGLAEKLLRKIKEALGLEEAMITFTGAAPITVDTLEYFGSLGVCVCECYGMSECCGATTWSTTSTHQWGSCGFALPGTEVKVFKVNDQDLNIKEECPAAVDPKAATDAEQGEICFRGRHIMNGYLANPKLGDDHVAEIQKKTQESIDKDGWLHSGDMGCIDKFGMVRITGRYKELIIGSGGENIAPVPIEDHIKKLCPAISNVMMIGDKRKFNTCVVTLKAKGASGEKPGTDELDGDALEVNPAITKISEAMKDETWQKYIQNAIDETNKSPACPSNASRIGKFVILPRDFSVETEELTPTLKLKRSTACKNFSEQIEAMYA
jgi:long-chain-fatty-acid--CoA ligase ACSBG